MFPTLRAARPLHAWIALLLLTAILAPLLQMLRMPAAFLLGPLLAAALVASAGAPLQVSTPLFIGAQALIGCMIARAFQLPLLKALAHDWPLFLFAVIGVLIVSCALSYVLMRYRVLPGTTAIWGSFPGAAMVMTLMAEAYGEDVRLVAFMQYLRMVCVALIASLVARMFSGSHAGAATDLLPAINWPACGWTLAVAVACAWVGAKTRLPAGALLMPMLVCAVLQDVGWLQVELPPALLALAYSMVGWTIGARFTRDILAHVARALPRVLLSILAMIALSGGIGYLLVLFAGIDPLTACLATSPGGADSIAIIAAGSKVDLPFVMAMQTARFVLILALGPVLARFLASRARATPAHS